MGPERKEQTIRRIADGLWMRKHKFDIRERIHHLNSKDAFNFETLAWSDISKFNIIILNQTCTRIQASRNLSIYKKVGL